MSFINALNLGKYLFIYNEPLKKEVEVSKESAPRLRNWILEAVEKIEKEQG